MTFDAWVISRLRAHGFYAGAVDSAPGRAMIEGLQKFQKAEGLKVTGMADADTVAALRLPGHSRDFPDREAPAPKAPPAEPVWMREGRRLMAIREVAGAKSDPTIMSWAAKLGGWVESFYKSDETPWCGLFIGNLVATTLPQEPLPGNPLGALEWGKLGVAMAKPALGAIMTFKRKGGGHVGLYAGEDRTHFHILGGNQNNSVSVTRIEKGRLVAIRWPKTGPEPVGGPVILTAGGVAVSRNEA